MCVCVHGFHLDESGVFSSLMFLIFHRALCENVKGTEVVVVVGEDGWVSGWGGAFVMLNWDLHGCCIMDVHVKRAHADS